MSKIISDSLSFDDVLIQPNFSTIKSRKDVNTSQNFLGYNLRLPVISSNMKTVTDSNMARLVREHGGLGCLHRFSDIMTNVKEAVAAQGPVMASFGVGNEEYNRAITLARSGVKMLCLDVAHGASMHVVEQFNHVRQTLDHLNLSDVKIVVGNFDNYRSIQQFELCANTKPDAYKIGIGGGANCTTRVVTGCGGASISSILDCARSDVPIIYDGGVRSSGDVVKALAAGASAVMLGGMFAATKEAPGEIWYKNFKGELRPRECFLPIKTNENGKQELVDTGEFDHLMYKKHYGSASALGYKDQGKEATHRTPEGEESYIKVTGTVSDLMQRIDAGLRSGMSYVGANNLTELRELSRFVRITTNGLQEGKAHGRG